MGNLLATKVYTNLKERPTVTYFHLTKDHKIIRQHKVGFYNVTALSKLNLSGTRPSSVTLLKAALALLFNFMKILNVL